MKSIRYFPVLSMLVAGLLVLGASGCDAVEEITERASKKLARTEAELPVDKWVKIGGHSYGLSTVTSGDKALFEYVAFGKTEKGRLPVGSVVLLDRHQMAGIKQDPEVPDQDFTMNILRSNKLISGPVHEPVTSADGKLISGKLAFYSKRQATNRKGAYLPKRQLLRFAFDYEIDAATGELLGLERSEIIVNRPFGRSSGDLGVFEEGEDVYLVSAATLEGNIVIYRLSNDLTDVEELVSETEITEHHREAPSVFKKDGMWYIHTSGTSGWIPNQHKYCYAPDLKGPWSDWFPIGDETGFHSQVFGVAREEGVVMFNGTRNAQLWGGPKNPEFPGIYGKFPQVRLPIRFNTPEKLAVSYYNDVRGKGDSLIVGQKDEGRKLEIQSVTASEGAVGVSALTDEDVSTQWESESENAVLTFTLPEPRVVKAVKIHNRVFKDRYTRLISAAKIELGDEKGNYTQIYNNWILQFAWMQSIPVPEKKQGKAKTVRITFLGSITTSNSKNSTKWGFKEIEIWGGYPEPPAFLKEDGPGIREFKPRAGTALAFTAGLPNAEAAEISTSIAFVANSKSDGTGTQGKVCELFLTKDSAGSPMGLSIKEPGDSENLQHIRMVRSGQTLETVINTDSHTYDVFLDGEMVWGGAKLLSTERFIESVAIQSSHKGGPEFPVDMSFRSKKMK